MVRDVRYWKRQLNEARNERSYYEKDWQKIIEVIDPIYCSIEKYLFHDPSKSREIYDSRGIRGHDGLVNALHSSLFPLFSPHGMITIRNKQLLDDYPDLHEWLAYVNETLFSAYAQSNFHREAQKSVSDIVSFGFAANLQETYPFGDSRYGDLIFTSIPFNEVYPFEGKEGTVVQIIREFKMRNELILENPDWRQAIAANPDLFRLIRENPSDKQDLLHIITPVKPGERTLVRSHTYISLFILDREEGIELNRHGEFYEGFDECPVQVPRWKPRTGNVYSRSPAQAALGDVLSLQVLAKQRLKAIPNLVTPPLQILQGSLASEVVSLLPGAQNIVKQLNAISPILEGHQVDVAYFEGEHLAKNIRSIMHWDDFRYPEDLPQMTAEEARIRSNVMQGLFGPVISAIDYEWSRPQLDRSLWILVRAGRIPPPPAPVDQRDIAFEMISPLAQMQRYTEVQQAEGLLRTAVEMSQVYPEILAMIDGKKLLPWMASRMNQSLFQFLRKPEEAEKILQMQQMAQGAPAMAKALKDASVAQLNMKRAQYESPA